MHAKSWLRQHPSAGLGPLHPADGSSNPTGADLRLVWDALADSGIPELALERTSAGGLVRRYLNGPLLEAAVSQHG
jgi:hypothetical protein